MKTIEYFKLQAKNLYRDFKTQKPYYDPTYGRDLYQYTPKYFDVDALALDFDIDEDNFTLMNSQHCIAKLAGFTKWTEMLKASPSALQLSKLLFENMHKISIIEWDIYLSAEQREKDFLFDDEDKLDIFQIVFADVDGHQTDGYDYRLSKKTSDNNQIFKPMKIKNNLQISALPLAGADRIEFLETAESAFERVMQRVEPDHPDLVRNLWNANNYIDEVLQQHMLPIDKDYALSLIDAFLVQHVVQLAVETDQQAESLN
ncbi:hypothetical protein L1276_000882 [Flavobacterium sp. HSC-32F16]|uniref:hypothetical protein n=1 Tax=Flavobacterium sp. HSC-32F16 TaxID=2910964 RepID=UPI0020A54CC5|nr:hypothetical protein [Flavobacterium sp. HSC-32F16]MCP2025742.1 hypothetical protein [Flavobacterium sp. HSC-32F16]